MGTARMEGYDDADTTADDVTELRAHSGGGSGKEAPTPRVLKQRFVLEEKLGSGGMGTVYRARDLRKVEARDRHPYVAVKVLNADFRNHPDAFIALQREASKSQAIAHPNIVSIFDFDKDGDIPYMVMELLEGRELTRLLRDYPGGIPDDIAWPVVEGLSAGLIRAHEAGITHADFKPGNVYVSGSHEPKIFDFGIARAVRLNQARGDDTVFDPSKLAALTPAYASKEMLTGESPSPSDDIYSFAIVVYLIFSGRHPYDRMRADEAQRQGMVPERIRRLTRRQWRTLGRCLAFDRSERPETMHEVAKGLIEGPRLGATGIAALSAAAVVAVATIWFVATRSERETVARDAVVDAQSTRVEELLAAPVFDPEWNLKLAEAMQQLKASPGGDAATDRLLNDVRSVYLARLDRTTNLTERAQLLAGAETALDAPFDEGRARVQQAIEVALDSLLKETPHDAGWRMRVEDLLDHAGEAYPGLSVAPLAKKAVDEYLATADAIVLANRSARAHTSVQPWIDAVARRLPSIDSPDAAAEKLRALQALVAHQNTRAKMQRDQQQLENDLKRIDDTVCQRLDPGDVARTTKRLAAAHPRDAQLIQERAINAVTRCIVAAGEVDQDQAMSLKQNALLAFGDVPALHSIVLDACAMRYLIGHGTAPGRSGFCADTLSSGAPAPKLVVVPTNGDGGRFAITKYEISARELASFCASTNTCATDADDLPARHIGVDVAIAYAGWLSAQSGHTYRLPTIEEWRNAAASGSDPNRNCQVQLAGVERGGNVWPTTSGQPNAFGVVNALGNVQEWVTAGDSLVAVGGAYNDPLANCAADFSRSHQGTDDAFTGIRLVREIR